MRYTIYKLYGRYFFKPESLFKDKQYRDMRTLTEDEEGQTPYCAKMSKCACYPNKRVKPRCLSGALSVS